MPYTGLHGHMHGAQDRMHEQLHPDAGKSGGASSTHVQGLVMMMQNRYQRRRMYTRIALGKNRAMDVVSGESSGSSGQLVIIYPMLMGLQALQAGIGALCLRDASILLIALS